MARLRHPSCIESLTDFSRGSFHSLTLAEELQKSSPILERLLRSAKQLGCPLQMDHFVAHIALPYRYHRMTAGC
jgi:hypothetical protein